MWISEIVLLYFCLAMFWILQKAFFTDFKIISKLVFYSYLTKSYLSQTVFKIFFMIKIICKFFTSILPSKVISVYILSILRIQNRLHFFMNYKRNRFMYCIVDTAHPNLNQIHVENQVLERYFATDSKLRLYFDSILMKNLLKLAKF